MSDITIELTNFQMAAYKKSLEAFMNENGVFGYAVARNYRKFNNETLEHEHLKVDLLNQYGQERVDQNGNSTSELYIDESSPYYKKVVDELNISGNIAHKVIIYKVSGSDIPQRLSARDILTIDWMIED